jgi:superfamily II DNA or RNA helicase
MIINKIPSKEQKEAIQFLLSRKKALVCYGTGTGKTLIMLSVAKLHLEHKGVNTVFIVGTKSALKSIKKELWDTFEEKGKGVEEYLQGQGGIILLSYDEMSKLIRKIRNEINVLILDEFHKVKSPKTQVTKNSNCLKMKCQYWYGFTATPIMKDFKDLYNLVKWLNPLIFESWEKFCTDYTLFYRMPLLCKGRKIDVLKPYKLRNVEKLNRLLKTLIISYFPDYDLRYVKDSVALEDVEGYRKAIADSLISTGDEDKDKALPMLAVKKGKHFVALSKSKLKSLYARIKKTISSGVIVYCDEYKTLNPVYSYLSKCGFNILKYTGKQTDKQNDSSMQKFLDDPKNKILLLSRVAGASLNLHVTNHLIMFDMPSSIGAVQQLMGRVARRYSQYSTYYIYLLITESSVEDYWYQYITMYAEPLKRLFNNGLVPSGIPSYNEFIKKRLIKDYVWNR